MSSTVQSTWQAVRTKLVRSQFVRHVGVLTLANFVSATLSFVQGILVARWLSPELYGVAALVMSYPNLVYTFFDARSGEASVKYLSEFQTRGERERVLAMLKLGYTIDFAVASLAFLAVVVTAPWAARRIAHNPEATGLIVIFAAALVPRALFGTSAALLATLGRFPVIALLDTFTTFLRVGLVVGLVLAGWQIAGVVWANAIATAATGLLYGIVAFALVLRTWGTSWLSGRWRDLKGYRRAIVGFLACNDLNALLGMIPKQLDVVLLGYFRNPTEVGYYKLARNLASVVGYLVGPLQSVTYPELARLWGLGDREGLRRRVRQLAWQAGVPLGFMALAVTALVPFVLPILVGDAYRPAMLATEILLAGSAVWLTFFWLRPTYLAQGKMRQWLFISTSIVVLSLTIYPFVIYQWGYLGLATWWGLMQLLGHTIAAWRIW